MSFEGVIVGGKVELAEPIPLPDGTPVRVERDEPAAVPVPDGPIPTLYERLKGVIGKATGLPPDASVNCDHYLYGTPKRQP